MTKEEALEIIKLLSGIESWAFSQQNRLPDYLHQKIDSAMDALTSKVLE